MWYDEETGGVAVETYGLMRKVLQLKHGYG
jgi:hypothetical protein